MQSRSEVLGVHQDSNSENGSSFGSVSVHSHTLPHSRALLLTCTLANPCLGREPKARVATTMQKITNEYKEGDVTFCEHATSHMRVLACNIRNIRLTKANAVLHQGLVLHHVEDGLGNNVK